MPIKQKNQKVDGTLEGFPCNLKKPTVLFLKGICKEGKRAEGLSLESCWTVAVILPSNSVIFRLFAQGLRDLGPSYSLPVAVWIYISYLPKKDFNHQAIGYMLGCFLSVAVILGLIMLSLFSQRWVRITPSATGRSLKAMWPQVVRGNSSPHFGSSWRSVQGVRHRTSSSWPAAPLTTYVKQNCNHRRAKVCTHVFTQLNSPEAWFYRHKEDLNPALPDEEWVDPKGRSTYF